MQLDQCGSMKDLKAGSGVQSRAALPNKAFETYEKLLKHGLKPDHYTIAMLIDACSRAQQPWRASKAFDMLFPHHKIEPDVSAWNSLLGSFAKAGHKVNDAQARLQILSQYA